MQALSPAVAGNEPAAPSGVSRSHLVFAFLGVALAHAALIVIFLKADPEPAERPVRSIPIVARLLGPQAEAMPVAAQSTPRPPVGRVQRESDSNRQQGRTSPSRVLTQRASAIAPIGPQAAGYATQPAPVAAPAQPSQSRTSTAGTTSTTSAGSTAARVDAASTSASLSESSAATAAARETIAIASSKHVEHANCRIVKPAYPELSKRRDETGTATVHFVIGATGAIETVALAKSSGFPRLDNAAVEALRASTCEPYVENGSPIRVSYTQAFTFGLDDD